MSLVLCGDALERLKTLPSESVDCCVTSPPYWALRDYGVDGQLGLEKTFTEYIDKLCNIFDEVKRVLKNGGTCWVNMGDTYNSHSTGNGGVGGIEGNRKNKQDNKANTKKDYGQIADKCLCQIPSRFAIEMCNRGWILRNEIIWHKPNCMPSSVKDRFTVDFEKVFFFTKNHNYYFEQQYEHQVWNGTSGKKNCRNDEIGRSDYANEKMNSNGVNPNGRNKRCVWAINTKPFNEAHFATYPEKLIEPMIKAGCPVGGTVLDPFGGSGTTAQVAIKQDKQYVLIELNPEYIPLIQKRLDGVSQQIKLEVTK